MIDEHGEGLYRDFRLLYGIDLTDVAMGRYSPSLMLSLVQGLPDDCYTYALASGGREFLGWGRDRHLSADTFDAIQTLIRVTGNWKPGKEPKLKPYPRPSVEEAKPVTVADLFKTFKPGKW